QDTFQLPANRTDVATVNKTHCQPGIGATTKPSCDAMASKI
ncbi:MAG: hypothetical protein ACI814_004539, partial [Mariniblastus sp.]